MRRTASKRCGNPMQGKILGGHYQIISHLGGGGFGTTFVAEDRHLPGNPRCVVKQLKPKTADNALAWEAARRLFNREAEVLYQLGNHQQIPRLFAHFEQDQEFYLVQELIEGHELRQEFAAVRQLDEADVINILKEILEILIFVHQQNVIHRDIKPANIIRRKQDGKLVLIDFGAVKQFNNQVIDSQGFSSMTIAVGSPGYMPNEQLAGKPRFSSDIYAVGMMGIQALTGLSPRQLPEDPKTCEIVWRDSLKISTELADVLDRMVRYDFRQRYQSASEALEAINSVPAISLASTIKILPIAKVTEIHSLPTKTILFDELSSECGIDYTRLQDLLAAGKWKEADEETRDVILKAASREKEGLVRGEDIDRVSCTDLCTIDNLWIKYSNERFGFSVQSRIHEDLLVTQNYDINVWRCFGERVGWCANGRWLDYNNLIFAIDADLGGFPVLTWMVYDSVRSLFSRVKACGLQQQSDKLLSDRGIDYTLLRDLLAAGKWKEANWETETIMLKVCKREEEGWLRNEDIEKFTCQDLRTIDKLWIGYSKGRFGFSVQQQIWQRIADSVGTDYEAWCQFGDLVCWRVNGFWLTWNDLNFTLNASVGHLPAPAGRGLQEWFMYFFSSVKACCEQDELNKILLGKKLENSINVNPKNLFSVKNRIEVLEGDVIEQKVDAIVNSTDPSFSGIGLLDNAVQRAAGPQLREACRQITSCTTGEARITSGYNLPARWIIHTVSPGWWGWDDHHQQEELLAQCYRNCLALAEQYAIKTIAFPAIRTGERGFPIEIGCKIAVREVIAFLEKNTSIEKVILVCFGKNWQKYYDCYLTTIKEIFK